MKTILEKIREDLFSMQDLPFRDFQAKLIPDMDKEKVIGVRTPDLRKYAKEIAGSPDIGEFLENLPHHYYEENNLHAFLIERIRDYGNCITEVKRFLPFVDNWATCDVFAPKIFARHKEELLDEIRKWIASRKTYTIRYGIGMLMRFFLDEDFRPEYPEMVSGIRSEEYYVNMMTAWYFATALAKQYEAVIPYFEKQRLDDWTHNKAIQKACESRRITPQQKEYLRTLKVRKNGKGNGGL
ncbi:MAG TPA: DNA alkylation repair protein [Candidatus Blautia intestinavium]|nr:DNA alkylation repair protein [Candidatus Blautia intestinavium]